VFLLPCLQAGVQIVANIDRACSVEFAAAEAGFEIILNRKEQVLEPNDEVGIDTITFAWS